MDEPMHCWYDPKLGMFDVLDEADVRKRYAPKVIEGEVISPEDARDLGGAVADLPGCDLRTAEEMLAAGLDVRLDVGEAEGFGVKNDIVDVDAFANWFVMKDLDLAAQLLAWRRAFDLSPEGDAEEVWKTTEPESPVVFFNG